MSTTTFDTPYPICPYCESEYEDSHAHDHPHAISKDGEEELTCRECERSFIAYWQTVVTYTTEEIK